MKMTEEEIRNKLKEKGESEKDIDILINTAVKIANHENIKIEDTPAIRIILNLKTEPVAY